MDKSHGVPKLKFQYIASSSEIKDEPKKNIKKCLVNKELTDSVREMRLMRQGILPKQPY